MGRPERPLDLTAGPIAAFAHELRVLRSRAGNASYRELARAAHFAPSVLSSAASGRRLPTLAVTLAFVSACGGDRLAWEQRWRSIAGQKGDDEPPKSRTKAVRPAQLPPGSRTFVGSARSAGQGLDLGDSVHCRRESGARLNRAR